MLTLLNAKNANQEFPDPESALIEPDGLLAVGGCLSPRRLINAYRKGIFPWFNHGDPILWWCPDPRLVLTPSEIRISRSLRKILRKKEYAVTFDQAFHEVIKACAAPRSETPGTWITEPMIRAYLQLHKLGFAHSAEAWYRNRLAGGLYGVAIGRAFFGESMFYRRSNASKAAFAVLAGKLARWNYAIIDCQVRTEHLASFGGREIPRKQFVESIAGYCEESVAVDAWTSESSDQD
ncbi:MAG: leucyl/phenylalanyl-tRNA--protein transferase [Methylococcaceae bacterium]|nr:leucyl/phenylalanyl-tRNA--protein transferase [Methylococcaceae bacterium]